MSAKPQPMAGQSDAADDLIAELAKLMAQDAKGDRPTEAAFPAFSVRIPGGENTAAPTPGPRFDFDHTVALAAEQLAEPRTVQPSAPAVAVVNPPAAPEPSESFNFDFGFGQSRTAPADTAPTPDPAAEHDSIADLIAAELSDTPEPEPVAEPVAVAVPPRAPSPAPAAWQPTTVATSMAGPEQQARAELRTLNLRPRSEQDRFKVPPVFGLGSKPVPAEPVTAPVPVAPTTSPIAEPSSGLRQPAPAVAAPAPAPVDNDLGLDPIDEIEHLIGRAMRVEFDKPAEPVTDERPAASPALHSLAATAAPVAAEPAVAPRALSGADEAILAAAKATGAEIGWVEAPEVNEFEAVAPVAAPRGRRSFGVSRSLAGPLVAVALLLAAGFGLYWVLGLGRDAGPAPLLTADAGPTKETPAVQPEAAAAPQSVVFDEINGVVPGAEEQLVSRDQADVNEVTQVPPTTEVSEEGLANRKVRTVTVRPDGTIVSGDDSVAGSAILPVARPNVPEVPGADTAIPDLIAAAEPVAATPPAAAAAAAVEPAAVPAATVVPVEPGSTVQAVDSSGNPLAGKMAPVPMAHPDGLQATAPTATAGAPVTAVVSTPSAGGGNLLPPPPANSPFGTPAAPATAAVPAAASQPAATTTIPGATEVDALPNSAPAYAQLASLRTEEEARQAAQRLVNRFGPLFGGANMEVQRVDLGARGIYYRVRVPAASTAAAGNICTNVIAAGGDCVPM